MGRAILRAGLALLLVLPGATAAQSFVNWESPHVHPLDLTPDGQILLAVNTPDNRLEVFSTAGREPVPLGSVPVGLDPVSVRARSSREAWVVNHVSDNVSVVDLSTLRVRATLDTDDEPADVVFAGNPERAFVSCSQANSVLVFDPGNLAAAPQRIEIFGEDPRALAASPDGSRVYVAIFESGNGSTILGGGSTMSGGFPPNVVDDGGTPHGGANPPPNDGGSFEPPLNPGNPVPIDVGLIVKKDAAGAWRDDTGADWTSWVSGSQAGASGRPMGWNLPDHDVAVIDTSTLGLTYIDRLMNLCMAVATNPFNGRLAVVGTDATNEIRFEPVLSGRFLRVMAALVTPSGPTTTLVDLNGGHLDYSASTLPQATRDLSLGDPRGVAWNGAGTRAWITGMGSNNVVVVNESGARAGLSSTIEVGQGPTGIVLHEGAGRAYVLNKFEGSLSVLSLATELETARVPFFDPTPAAISAGRSHLYDTHRTSGLGHIACASCHADARMDRLAWDLGDPSGDSKPVDEQNKAAGIPGLGGTFPDWHAMKGPMTTQTLQDIIGKEPLHWRGDRDGLEEFNPAFVGLQGDDALLTSQEMQQYEDFLATIHFPPNPFRNFDNTLPTSLPLPGHFTTGDFGAAGLPLPNGNAVQGLASFRPPNLLDGGALACVTCHTLPTGLGTDYRLNGFVLQPIAPGPNGERHHALVAVDGSTNVSLKIPHLRNVYEKVGFELTQTSNRAGFGFLHDGSIDSLARFVAEPVFNTSSNQQVANLVAFMLAFSGGELPSGSPFNLFEPPGTASRDTHAGVGTQTTIVDGAAPTPGQLALIASMLAESDADDVGVVVKGVQSGLARGYAYLGNGAFQSDRQAEQITAAALQAAASPGSELTWTVVPFGSETRIGIDRDLDDHLDRDELDAGSDPADPDSFPRLVHVDDILPTLVSKSGTTARIAPPGLAGQGQGKQHSATAVVTVVDENGVPVEGALVSADWTGTTTDAQIRATDAAGEAQFAAPPTGVGSNCWTLTVLTIAGDGLTYQPGANVETSDSVGTACP